MEATLFIIGCLFLVAWIIIDKIRMHFMLKEIRRVCRPIITGEKPND